MEKRIYRTRIRGGFMKMRLIPPVAAQGAWPIAGRSAAGAILLAVTVSACTGGGSSVPSILAPTAPGERALLVNRRGHAHPVALWAGLKIVQQLIGQRHLDRPRWRFGFRLAVHAEFRARVEFRVHLKFRARLEFRVCVEFRARLDALPVARLALADAADAGPRLRPRRRTRRSPRRHRRPAAAARPACRTACCSVRAAWRSSSASAPSPTAGASRANSPLTTPTRATRRPPTRRTADSGPRDPASR